MIHQEHPVRKIQLKSRLLPSLVIVLAVLQLFFPFKGWVILLSGFGGMWLISFLWARSLYKNLYIERELRFGWKQVGDRLRERILLRNKGWAPSLWVEIDDHSDMNEYDISSVIDIQGYRQRNWHTQGFCDTRGLYTLGPVTLQAQDPFGIYQVAIDYTDSANMMVVPPVISLPEIEIASGGRVGEGRSSVKGVEQTISTVGVREYVPGDSLRFLHWPTIARMGDLYVHLFDNEPSSDWWVLLDMDQDVHVGEGSRSTEEHGVILAASLVNRGIERGKHVGLVTYGDDLVWHPPEIGNAHLWTILRSLATIHPGGPSLEQIMARLRSSLESNSSLVIITPNLSPGWLNALELLKRSGIVPTVLLLDPVSFGGEGDVEAFRTRLRRLNITHYTVSADILDQPKKQPKGLRWLIEQTRLRGNHLDEWQARWHKFRKTFRTWALILAFYYVMGNLLGASIRGLETNLIWFLVAGGLFVGWFLSKSRLTGWAVAFLSSLIGFVIAFLRIGRLGGPIYTVFIYAGDVLRQWGAERYYDGPPIDWEPFLLQLNNVWIGISGLGERLGTWVLSFGRGQTFYDPVAITLVWGFSIWIVVIWSMWSIFRHHRPFPAFIPAIGLVSVSLALGGKTSYDLAFMFGSTIALMAFINFDLRENMWLREQLTYQPTIGPRVFIVASLLTVSLIVFSLITPSITVERLTDLAWYLSGREPTDTHLAQSLGLEHSDEPVERNILDVKREGGLPNEHLIGSGPELSEQVVMVVQVDASLSGIPEESLVEAFSPLYIRSLVYDRYLGYGWASRDTQIENYNPGDQIPMSTNDLGRPVQQQIQFVEDLSGIMYTVGTPLSADQDFQVAWRIQNESHDVYDIFGATVEGETYRANSMVQINTIEELRSAGQVYPEWMLSRYMSLPNSVPERVLTLARDLTATETNPYDRAVAIESYLRQFPYTLNVSRGPAGMDIADYFLFRLQEGYCDYYATAMVVLARAAGMPARYVIGYIGEHYDESIDAYVITADQAHAWPEIYFPGYGWIQFEPTGGRPPIERPAESFPELPENFQLDFQPLSENEGFSFDNWATIFWISLLLVAILAIVVQYISDLWLAHLSPEKQLPKIFRRLYRFGRLIHMPDKPGLTPYEFSDYLCTHIQLLASGSYWPNWLLSGRKMVRELSQAYVRIKFNPATAETMNSKDLFGIYKRLRLTLWLVWLLGRVHKYWFLRSLFWEDAPLTIAPYIEEGL